MIQADDNTGSSSSCINTFSAPADGFNSIMMMMMMMILIMMVMMTTMIMLMLIIMKIPGGTRDAHGPPRVGGRPHGADDDGRWHHGCPLWGLYGHCY